MSARRLILDLATIGIGSPEPPPNSGPSRRSSHHRMRGFGLDGTCFDFGFDLTQAQRRAARRLAGLNKKAWGKPIYNKSTRMVDVGHVYPLDTARRKP